MIITNSNQLHDHLYEFMEDKMCFRKLKSMILLIKKKFKKMKISARFWPIFDFELKGKRSRAELKILQLEPARLGLITNISSNLHFVIVVTIR